MHALRVSWKCRIPPTTRFTIFHKSDFLLSLQKPSVSHANGKRRLSATKELNDPIRMWSGFYSLFTSACDAYILSFDFLATILSHCSWKMQTSERGAGLLPWQSAYGNVDLADGVCGYLCMSNFALLWLRNVPRWQLKCVCVVCVQWSGCWFHSVSPHTVLEGPIARFILPRPSMCVCIDTHSTWSAFNIRFQVLKTCFHVSCQK